MSELLAAAEQQLARLPAPERQPNWPGSLARLSEARTGLEAAYAYWKAERDALVPSSAPGTDAYDEVLAERNADAWSYLCDWADSGHVLTEIARATTRHDASPAAKAAEHTRAIDNIALPPQAPGRPHPHRGPR
ncbi:hypothetical protein [Streptomyces sp. HPF1205]|uniref:hypothetical protein n=1 Tax=Streptomyces sp. HPF1205 TaxID=2873262 RepID=UPI001CEC2D96|nr:hypothetical protein [Streptomyces sp. HPF1205]